MRLCLIFLTIYFFCVLFPNHAEAEYYFPKIKILNASEKQNFWYIQDDSVPVVSMRITFVDAGSKQDSDEKLGLTTVMTNLLDQGAGEFDNLAFQSALEEDAIVLNFSNDDDNVSATLYCTKEKFNKALSMLRIALFQPKFDDESTLRIKANILSRIKSRRENPAYIASLQWQKEYYGNHPYGRESAGNEESLNRISSFDIKQAWERKIIGSQVHISIAGDINPYEAKSAVRSLAPQLDTYSIKPNFTQTTAHKLGQTIKLEHNSPQGSVIFGYPAVPYNSPDFFPLYVLTHIIGSGSFDSILVNELREKRGLVYGVSANLNIMKEASIILGSADSRGGLIPHTEKALRQAFEKVAQNGVTESQLMAAKLYLTGSYSLRFDSTANLSGIMNFLQTFGFDENYTSKRNDLIKKVKLEDVNRVAKQYLDPSKLFVVIAAPNVPIEPEPEVNQTPKHLRSYSHTD